MTISRSGASNRKSKSLWASPSVWLPENRARRAPSAWMNRASNDTGRRIPSRRRSAETLGDNEFHSANHHRNRLFGTYRNPHRYWASNRVFISFSQGKAFNVRNIFRFGNTGSSRAASGHHSGMVFIWRCSYWKRHSNLPCRSSKYCRSCIYR